MVWFSSCETGHGKAEYNDAGGFRNGSVSCFRMKISGLLLWNVIRNVARKGIQIESGITVH